MGREDPLEEEIATHASILAWKIPWVEEPVGVQSMGSTKESGTTEGLNNSNLIVKAEKKISQLCFTLGT